MAEVWIFLKLKPMGFADEIDVEHEGKRGFPDDCKVFSRRKELPLTEMVKTVEGADCGLEESGVEF